MLRLAPKAMALRWTLLLTQHTQLQRLRQLDVVEVGVHARRGRGKSHEVGGASDEEQGARKHHEHREELIRIQRRRVSPAAVEVVVWHRDLGAEKGRRVDKAHQGLGQEAPATQAQQQPRALQRVLWQERVRRFQLLELPAVVEVEEEDEPKGHKQGAQLQHLARGIGFAAMRPEPVALR